MLTACSHGSLKYHVTKPESCHFFGGRTYISSIAGGMTEKSGKSSILQMEDDRPSTFVTGLNAPKGIRGFSHYLVVSDIDQIKLIDIGSRKIIKTLNIPEAKFLNDIDVDEDGNFFVSDSLGMAIYTGNILKMKVQKLIALDFHPNGVLLDKENLLIASWGQGIDEKWNTKLNGRLWQYNLVTKKLSVFRKERIGHLDGIEKFQNDGYLVSSKRENKIYHFRKNNVPVVLKEVIEPADIGFNGDIVCVPSLGHDTLEIIRP